MAVQGSGDQNGVVGIPQVSIIIPTLNAGAHIQKTLQYLHTLTQDDERVREIICVDGGSTDSTLPFLSVVQYRKVQIITAEKGRARQLNAGAAHATGNILYFLHADTTPPPSFISDILDVSTSARSDEHGVGGHVAGAFRLRFDSRAFLLRLYEKSTWLPFNWFRFGDQSFFITAGLFVAIGGYNEALTIEEDNDIVRRAARHTRITLIPRVVSTSAQKYHVNGLLRTQAAFTLIHVLYTFGASQAILLRVYSRMR